MVQIIEKLIAKGTKARPGTKRNGYLGITIHNTDNFSNGAGAKKHMIYMTQNGGANNQASYHYVVDDKEAYRLIPEDEVAWHAGDGTGNGNYKTIAIEICVNSDGDITKATNNAVELARDIQKRRGGNLYQHNNWSGKNCPSQIRKGNPYNWDTFKAKVASSASVTKSKDYEAHIQDSGWLGAVSLGELAGTTGKSKRMEAFRVFIDAFISSKLHIQSDGWKEYKGKGTICGTVGQSKRVECISMNIPGHEFRVHQENTGYTSWTDCDGISTLGSVGQSLRLEAIQIRKK